MAPIHVNKKRKGTSSSSSNRATGDDDFENFHRFNELPIELRLMIWEFALPGERDLFVMLPPETEYETDYDASPIRVRRKVPVEENHDEEEEEAGAEGEPEVSSEAAVEVDDGHDEDPSKEEKEEDEKEDKEEDGEDDEEEEDEEEDEEEEVEEEDSDLEWEWEQPKKRIPVQWGIGSRAYAPDVLNKNEFLGDFVLPWVCRESREFCIDFGYKLLYETKSDIYGNEVPGPWFCPGYDTEEWFDEEEEPESRDPKYGGAWFRTSR
ncbi:hypothetical protein F4808DRAFT_469128 [Astrocystis sublimbata]|nr:hypothetical protein F4808DRAFT_469128 [Astrocystis sublimbata]